jgi:hypothetical protein
MPLEVTKGIWDTLKTKSYALALTAPFVGVTTFFGVVAGTLGALYEAEVKTSFPLYWGYGPPMPWHAAIFWIAAIGFGLMFGLTFQSQAKANDAALKETYKGLEIIRQSSETLARQIQTMPPADFLGGSTDYLELCVDPLDQALTRHSDSEALAEAIRTILISLVSVAHNYGASVAQCYSVSLMVYRPFADSTPEKVGALMDKMIFKEKYSSVEGFLGALELLPEFTYVMENKTIKPSPDRRVHLVLGIPREQRDGTRDNLLPGAPKAFWSRDHYYCADTSEILKERPEDPQLAHRKSVLQEIEDYFGSGAGASIASFVSIPLYVNYKRGDHAVGVVNIDGDSKRILRGEAAVKLFVPVTAPYRILLASLLGKYLNLHDKGPI